MSFSFPPTAAPVNNRRAFTQILKQEDAATIRQRIEIRTDFTGIADELNGGEALEQMDVFDYELALSTFKTQIAQDPCPDLLKFPEDDIEILTEKQQRRTAVSTVPADALKTVPELFVTDCIRFYDSDWTSVERKNAPQARVALLPAPAEELPTQVYEIDIPAASSSSSSTPVPEARPNVDPLLVASLAFARHNARQSRKGNDPGGLPPLSKWKKRYVVLRHVSPRDPLLLELYKDEKKGIKETLDVSSMRNIELVDGYGAAFKINLHGEALLFNAESEAICMEWVRKIEEHHTAMTVSSEPLRKLSFAPVDMHEGKTDTLYQQMLDEVSRSNPFLKDKQTTYMEMGRPDIFRVYSALEEARLEDIPPAKLAPQVATQILVTCEDLRFRLAMNHKGAKVNTEPFYCSLALYDIKDGVKISENFHFDLNNRELFPTPQADRATLANEAIFSVFHPHQDMLLVLFVEKIIQKDIPTIADIYIKGADNDKLSEKQREAIQPLISRLHEYRMPFAWAARPVFTADGAVDTTSAFSSLFRQEHERLGPEEMMRVLSDFHKSLQSPSSAKFKGTIIPGHFKARVSPMSGLSDTYTLNPSLVPILNEETSLADQIPRREVLAFPSTIEFVPHMEFYHFLYVYPLSVSFSNIKSSTSKARNIVCRVELLENDLHPLVKPQGLKCVYGRSSGQLLGTYALTPVLHHNKSPTFYDEIKIALPTKLTSKHHLLFTFLHVSVDNNKKDKKAKPEPIGYSVLPLIQATSKLGGDDKIIEGQSNLAVVNAGHYYGHDVILPAHYLDAVAENTLALANGNSSPPQTPVHSNAGYHVPTLKWLEHGKPLFSVTTKVCSTVYTKDEFLRSFFRSCEFAISTPNFEHELSNRIKALHGLTHEALVHYLPVILNRLFALLPLSDHTSPHDVGLNVVRYLISAVSLLPTTGSATSPLLRSYARYIFQSPTIPSSNKTVHSELVLRLGILLSQAQSDVQTIENLLKNCWFFFQIVSKSMVQYLEKKGLMGSQDRKARFPVEFLESLSALVPKLALAIKQRIKRDLSITDGVNHALGVFICDCFATMDRGFVFSLCQRYISTISNDQNLIDLKFKFLKIVCSYEHYIPLNLPLVPAKLATYDWSLLKPGKMYMSTHYLSGLLITEVAAMIDHPDKSLRRNAIVCLRNVLARLDFDERYDDRVRRHRVAALHFPVVHLVLENASRLSQIDSEHDPDASGDVSYLDSSETRDLLMCFLYVIKNLDHSFLSHWWRHSLPPVLFDVLFLCIQNFQYIGKDEITSPTNLALMHNANAKKILEEQYGSLEITGRRISNTSTGTPIQNGKDTQKKRRFEIKSPSTLSLGVPGQRASLPMLERRGSASSSASSLQVRPGSVRRVMRFVTSVHLAPEEIEDFIILEGNLSAEVSLVAIDMLYLFFEDFTDLINRNQGVNQYMAKAYRLLLEFFKIGQSEALQPNMFAVTRDFVRKYSNILFDPALDLCQEICFELLRGCNSRLSLIRAHSIALLYTLLKLKLPRVSLDVTIALSKIAGDSSTSRSDEELKRSLTVIADYAQRDITTAQDFHAKVEDLTKRLRTVLVDTSQMKNFEDDPEMLVDLQYRIAKSYSNSPELRVTWLESMANLHIQHESWSEAAMCVVHALAIVAERLKDLPEFPSISDGAHCLVPVSRNVLEEGHRAWDASPNPLKPSPTSSSALKVAPDAKETVRSSLFSEKGLQRLMRLSVYLLKKAHRYELVSHIYKISMPFLEKERNYGELAEACGDLKTCYEQIIFLNGSNKRRLGTYFRVGFFGNPFQDLNGIEFIYKEPFVTPLSEISLRLKDQYTRKFGDGRVNLLTDSKKVDPTSLNMELAHIQITYVEPFIDADSSRVTYFEKNNDLAEFIFEVPFTESGKARGSVSQQYKRKTILSVEGGFVFPYVKKRLMIVGQREVVLSPLDVAVEEMQRKNADIVAAVGAKPPDMVMIQMQLQGIVSLQVNSGPLEYATTFLREKEIYDQEKIAQLENTFSSMVANLERALQINEKLIAQDQHEYHEDLKKKLARFRGELSQYVKDVDKGGALPLPASLSNTQDLNPSAAAEEELAVNFLSKFSFA